MDIPKENLRLFDRTMLVFHSCVAYVFTIFYLESSKNDAGWPDSISAILLSSFFDKFVFDITIFVSIFIGFISIGYLAWKTGGIKGLISANSLFYSRARLRYFAPYAIPLYIVIFSEVILKN